MTLFLVFAALVTVTVFSLAVGALVDLLRHDAPRSPRRAPRSHPADEFDPYAQRFGPRAA